MLLICCCYPGPQQSHNICGTTKSGQYVAPNSPYLTFYSLTWQHQNCRIVIQPTWDCDGRWWKECLGQIGRNRWHRNLDGFHFFHRQDFAFFHLTDFTFLLERFRFCIAKISLFSIARISLFHCWDFTFSLPRLHFYIAMVLLFTLPGFHFFIAKISLFLLPVFHSLHCQDFAFFIAKISLSPSPVSLHSIFDSEYLRFL